MRKCLLDMDGVLVDFVGGACHWHGKTNPYGKPGTAGEWDVIKLIGMEPEPFWKNLGRGFWSGLDWMHDGKFILDVVEEAFGADNVCLLTSPCETDGCIDGKRDWVKAHMPSYSKRLLVGSAKEFCAGPDRLLIDDHPGNVTKFKAAGGSACLLPRPWNDLYKDAADGLIDGWLSKWIRQWKEPVRAWGVPYGPRVRAEPSLS